MIDVKIAYITNELQGTKTVIYETNKMQWFVLLPMRCEERVLGLGLVPLGAWHWLSNR